MRVDVWCSKPPYVDHVAPVWHALPEDVRGTFAVSPELVGQARGHGIEPATRLPASTDPLLVLSRCEFGYIPGSRPVIFMEHGAGATYHGRSHLPHRPEVVLVLTTPAQAAAHRAIYGERVVVVGCPKMDAHAPAHRRTRPARPVVAVSHHWDQHLVAETRSAWPWDAEAWERVAASGEYELIGHKHPGDCRDVEGWWASIGVEFVPTFAEVLERADMYVADNTSTLFEFAATGRPVVVLSPPFYRRQVDHGVRFWRHVPGAQVSHPDELEAVLAEAWADTPARRALRTRAVEAVYGPLDGRATERAVAAILRLSETPGACSIQTGADGTRGPKGDDMGPTIITTNRLYRTDPLTRVRTLAYPAGAHVPVSEYEELTGRAVAPEPDPAAVTAPEAADAPETPVAEKTVAELKAALDERGIEYQKRAKHAELVALLEAATANE